VIILLILLHFPLGKNNPPLPYKIRRKQNGKKNHKGRIITWFFLKAIGAPKFHANFDFFVFLVIIGVRVNLYIYRLIFQDSEVNDHISF